MAGAVSGGVQGAPNPLFKDPRLANMPDAPAGSGYTFDPVKGSYTRTIGSAPDDLAQRGREQGHQDMLSGQEQGVYSRLMDAMGGLGSPDTASFDGSFGSGFGGTGSPTAGAPIPARVSLATSGIMGALKGARDSAFASAKDRAAGTATAANNSLTEELQRRGLGGGGYEAGQVGNNLARESNQIGALDRQNLEDELGVQTHLADEQFQGDVTQRDADMRAQGENANRDLASREFAAQTGLARANITNQNKAALLSTLTGALNGLNRAY